MLILGGSATVTDLTGMNTVAACFLIPIGVSIYVLAGGMRATLIADYSHTLVLYCILISFSLVAYSTSSYIGSPSRMWELLREASVNHPVKNNAEGSYLTLRSKSGLIFGVLNIVGNFGETSQWPILLVLTSRDRFQRSGVLATGHRFATRDQCQGFFMGWYRLVRYSHGYCVSSRWSADTG